MTYYDRAHQWISGTNQGMAAKRSQVRSNSRLPHLPQRTFPRPTSQTFRCALLDDATKRARAPPMDGCQVGIMPSARDSAIMGSPQANHRPVGAPPQHTRSICRASPYASLSLMRLTGVAAAAAAVTTAGRGRQPVDSGSHSVRQPHRGNRAGDPAGQVQHVALAHRHGRRTASTPGSRRGSGATATSRLRQPAVLQ